MISLQKLKNAFSEFYKKITGGNKKIPAPLPVETPIETPVEIPVPEPTESDQVNVPIKKYVTGIDIYHGDVITSWTDLRKEIDFIFIKATEGDWRTDPKFISHRQSAKDAGIPCGHYHFYRSNKSAKEQAADFIKVVGTIYPGELPPVCDWETEDDPADGKDISEVQEFLDIIEKHFGMTPIIYSGSSFANDKKLPASFKRYPLWVAHYTKGAPKIPGPWPSFTFWQNTDKAKVKGVKNPCDFNFFNGSIEDLKNLCKK